MKFNNYAEKKSKFISNILMYWLFFLSGNPIIYKENYEAVLLLSLVIYVYYSRLNNKSQIQGSIVAVLSSFFIICIFQTILNNDFQVYTMMGFFVRVMIAFFAVQSIPKFIDTYVNVLYLITIISLIIHFFNLFFDIKELLLPLFIYPDKFQHILIHNFNVNYTEWGVLDVSFRNSAFFWEPAAFAGYLLIGLMFIKHIKENLEDRRVFKMYIVFLVGLLTTLSTTAYVLMPFALYYNFNSRLSKGFNRAFTLFIFILSFFILIIANSYSSFLSEKIFDEYQGTVSADTNYHVTRMGGIVFDSEDILQKPLFGWGPHPQSRGRSDDEVLEQGNGFSGFIVKFGFTGIILYLYFLYTSLVKSHYFAKKEALFFGVVIILLLNTEFYLGYPLFFCLLFLPQKLFKNK